MMPELPSQVVCWQVYIEGKGWQWADPEVAAFLMVRQNGERIRFGPMPVSALKFTTMQRPRRREVTAQRISAARRALARKVERAGLFGEHIAAELPTPEERIAGFDEAGEAFVREQRREEAKNRRASLAELETLPLELRGHAALRFAGWFGDRNGFYLKWIVRSVTSMLAMKAVAG